VLCSSCDSFDSFFLQSRDRVAEVSLRLGEQEQKKNQISFQSISFRLFIPFLPSLPEVR
jgi:hypothetical protein